jgi:hypothetical protein
MRDARPGTAGRKRLTAVEALNQTRRGQLRYNKTRAKHSAPSGLLIALQKGLETAGFSGAAHPVRRVQNIRGGGVQPMMLPWGGPGRKALSKAAPGEMFRLYPWSRPQPNQNYLAGLPRTEAVDKYGEKTVQRWEAERAYDRRHPVRTGVRKAGERLSRPKSLDDLIEAGANTFVGASFVAVPTFAALQAWNPPWWERAMKYHGGPFKGQNDRYDPPSKSWLYQTPDEAAAYRDKVGHQRVREWLYKDVARLEKAGANIDVPAAISNLKAAKYDDVFAAYVYLKNTHKPPPGGWSWK